MDEIMAKIINTNNIKMPIIRMGEGRYLLGTESKTIIMKGTTCVVRVGGGFDNLETYILRNEEQELNKIKQTMIQNNQAYEDVIKDLSTKY